MIPTTKLKAGEYISQHLLPAEYQSWKFGDKILISGSTNSGKTEFALNFAESMYNAYHYTTLYLTSRGLIRRQLQASYHQATSYVEFNSYHNWLDKIEELRNHPIIIVDECITFFDDSFIDKVGGRADQLLDFLLHHCNNSIIIFLSEQGYWLYNYVDHFCSGYYNFVELKIYQFYKDVNYSDIFIVSTDDSMRELLDQISVNDKAVYFCSDTDSAKLHKAIRDAEIEKAISASQHQMDKLNQKERKKLIKQIKLHVKANVALMNRTEYEKYNDTLYNKAKAGTYHHIFNQIINYKSFTADILVATPSMCIGLTLVDPNIKAIFIDLYDYSFMYQMIGRLKSIAPDVKLYIKLPKYSHDHFDTLITQKKILRLLNQSTNFSIYELSENYFLSQMQGLVRIKGGDSQNKVYYDEDDSGFYESKAVCTKQPSFLFLSINRIAEHKVFMDYLYYSDRSDLVDKLYHYNGFDDGKHKILPYNISLYQETHKRLEDNLLKYASMGAELSNDSMELVGIQNDLAILNGEFIRKRPSEMNSDFEKLGIPIKVSKRKVDVRDEKGDAIKKDGNRTQTKVWVFEII